MSGDIVLILAIATSTWTGINVSMLLAAQVANVARKLPWIGSFLVSVALWIAWVIIR